jgi:hypothetical protein
VTMRRGVIWPRDSLLPGGRGREPRERERGRGSNTLSETRHDLIGWDLMVHADWRLRQKEDSS